MLDSIVLGFCTRSTSRYKNREWGTWVLSRYTSSSSFIYYKRETEIERERGMRRRRPSVAGGAEEVEAMADPIVVVE